MRSQEGLKDPEDVQSPIVSYPNTKRDEPTVTSAHEQFFICVFITFNVFLYVQWRHQVSQVIKQVYDERWLRVYHERFHLQSGRR